jgi:orotidine-5'-phosphate decarboxylase
VRRIFGSAARLVLPSISREVLGAGPSVTALREAAARTNESFASLTG